MISRISGTLEQVDSSAAVIDAGSGLWYEVMVPSFAVERLPQMGTGTELIFGAARMNLKIRDLPIIHHERKCGETHISRWRHGWLLLKMALLAALRPKLI